MSEKKKEKPIGIVEVHLYGGILALSGGAAAWFGTARSLGAGLLVAGATLFYLGHHFLRRS